MKRSTLILLLSCGALTAASNDQIIESFNKESGLLRPSSNNFKELSKAASKIDSESARSIISKLDDKALKNFLFIWSNSQDQKIVNEVLLEQLLKTKSTKKRIITYFAKRSLNVSNNDEIIELCKKHNNQEALLELLAHTPSQQAFSYLSSLKDTKLDYLLNTVTKMNTEEVIQLLKNKHTHSKALAARLLRFPSKELPSDQQLIFLLKQKNKKAKPKFSAVRIDALVKDYQKLEHLTDEQIFKQGEMLFNSRLNSPELHRAAYNKIITQNKTLSLLLLAKCMHFELEHFKKYRAQVKPLYEAETRPRLKSILYLKDQKDPTLLPVFKNLMTDADSEVRYEAISTVAEMLEDMSTNELKQKQPTTDTIRILLNDPSKDVIVSSIGLISTLRNKDFNEEILKFSLHKNIEIQLAALLAIEKLEPIGGVPQLIKVLDDSNWNVRALAARALSRYDNKKTYQDEIDNKYRQELDPYVKQALYDSVKSSKSQLIANMIRNEIKNAEDSEIEQLHINLFELKSVTTQDLKSALPLFYKSKNADFIESWFEAANEKNVDILSEAVHILKNGDQNTTSAAISVLADKKIDLLDHIEEKGIAKLNDRELWRYLDRHTRVKNKTKLAILTKLFSDPKTEHFSYSLNKLLDDKYPDYERDSNDFTIGQDHHQAISKIIDSYERPLSNINELALVAYKRKELSDSEIQSWLSKEFDEEDYYHQEIITLFLKSLDTEKIKTNSDSITTAISKYKLSHYGLKKVIPHLSEEALTKIYESVSGNDKLQFLTQLAPTLSLEEIITHLNKLTIDKNNSRYYMRKIFEVKAPTLIANEVELMLEYSKKLDFKDYDYDNILRLVPTGTKSSFVQQLTQAKIKLAPHNIKILLAQVKEEHFPLIRNYLKTFELPESRYNAYNLSALKPALDGYIKTDDISKEQLVVFTKLSRYINYDVTIKDKMFAEAFKHDRSIQELVFMQMEKCRRTNQKNYYQLYKSLLTPPISMKLFTEKEKNKIQRFYSIQNQRQNNPKNTLFVKEKQEIATILKESIKSHSGSKKIDLCQRLAAVTSADDYIEFCAPLFKDHPEVMTFIPLEGFTDKSFIYLEGYIDLAILPKKIMFQLGNSLSKELQNRILKDFIDADEAKTKTLYPLVLALINQADAQVTLKLLNSYISTSLTKSDLNNHNEDYNFNYQEVNMLKKALKNNDKIQAIKKLLTEQKHGIDHYFFLALLGAKIPTENLDKVVDNKNSFNQNYFLLETAYISQSLSSKLIKLHENLLKTSTEKELEDVVALSTNNNYSTKENIEYDYDSTKDMLIQKIKQNNYSYGNKKNDLVEESPLTKPVENLKFKIASKPENTHLMKYVANNASVSLEDILRSWHILDEIVIDQITEKTLVQKLPKATEKEFKLFLSALESKTLNWQTASDRVFSSLNKAQMTKVSSIFHNSESPNKQILLPSIVASMENIEDAKRILTTVLSGTIENYYIHTNDPAKQKLFSKAIDSLFLAKKIEINEKNLFLFESFHSSHAIRLEIDKKFNSFTKEIQERLIRVLLRSGPYYPNALKAYSKKLDGPFDQRLFLNDSSYSYNPQFKKIKSEPSSELQNILNEIKQKKAKLYKTYSSSNPGLIVGLINYPELYFKEYPKALKQESLPAWTIYSLIVFNEQEHEKKLKEFIDKFKDKDGANHFIKRYLKQHKIDYSWIPAKYKDEDLGGFD